MRFKIENKNTQYLLSQHLLTYALRALSEDRVVQAQQACVDALATLKQYEQERIALTTQALQDMVDAVVADLPRLFGEMFLSGQKAEALSLTLLSAMRRVGWLAS